MPSPTLTASPETILPAVDITWAAPGGKLAWRDLRQTISTAGGPGTVTPYLGSAAPQNARLAPTDAP